MIRFDELTERVTSQIGALSVTLNRWNFERKTYDVSYVVKAYLQMADFVYFGG